MSRLPTKTAAKGLAMLAAGVFLLPNSVQAQEGTCLDDTARSHAMQEHDVPKNCVVSDTLVVERGKTIAPYSVHFGDQSWSLRIPLQGTDQDRNSRFSRLLNQRWNEDFIETTQEAGQAVPADEQYIIIKTNSAHETVSKGPRMRALETQYGMVVELQKVDETTYRLNREQAHALWGQHDENAIIVPIDLLMSRTDCESNLMAKIYSATRTTGPDVDISAYEQEIKDLEAQVDSLRQELDDRPPAPDSGEREPEVRYESDFHDITRTAITGFIGHGNATNTQFTADAPHGRLVEQDWKEDAMGVVIGHYTETNVRRAHVRVGGATFSQENESAPMDADGWYIDADAGFAVRFPGVASTHEVNDSLTIAKRKINGFEIASRVAARYTSNGDRESGTTQTELDLLAGPGYFSGSENGGISFDALIGAGTKSWSSRNTSTTNPGDDISPGWGIRYGAQAQAYFGDGEGKFRQFRALAEALGGEDGIRGGLDVMADLGIFTVGAGAELYRRTFEEFGHQELNGHRVYGSLGFNF